MKAFNQGSIVIALNMTQDKNLYFDLMFDLVPMKLLSKLKQSAKQNC